MFLLFVVPLFPWIELMIDIIDFLVEFTIFWLVHLSIYNLKMQEDEEES